MYVSLLWQIWFAMRFESLHSPSVQHEKQCANFGSGKPTNNLIYLTNLKWRRAQHKSYCIQFNCLQLHQMIYGTLSKKKKKEGKSEKFNLFVFGRKTSGWYYYLLGGSLNALCKRTIVWAFIVFFLFLPSIWMYAYELDKWISC